MQREERVAVQSPVKEQQPDGMSHRGYYGQMAVEVPRSEPPAKRMEQASIAALFQPRASASCSSSSSSSQELTFK